MSNSLLSGSSSNFLAGSAGGLSLVLVCVESSSGRDCASGHFLSWRKTALSTFNGLSACLVKVGVGGGQ